jgi:hypothetical protein
MNLDFDIDQHLNQYIPAQWLHRLPKWLSWCLGYRSELPRKVPTLIIWLWTFIGAFCGVSVVQAVFEQSQYFLNRHVPNIVGSFVHHLCSQSNYRVQQQYYYTARLKPLLHNLERYSSDIRFPHSLASASQNYFFIFRQSHFKHIFG